MKPDPRSTCVLFPLLPLLLFAGVADAQITGKIKVPKLPGKTPSAGQESQDPWWAAHGGALRLGAPDHPAVLFVHGLHQSAQDFLKPSVVGVNYDVAHAPADRDLGSSDTPGAGVESLGISNLAAVDQDNWFDFLASKGCTVATWSMPTYDVFQALGSALDALNHLQQATHALHPGAPPRIALVGHSLGGLVIRALLKEKGNLGGEIGWVITLCSPHQGSELATAPQKLEDDAAAWVQGLPLPGPLSAPASDIARQTVHALTDMFAPPLDPASKQLAPGSALFNALAAGESALPGVRYDTFGGTNPNYLRVYAWCFDAESTVPQFKGASVYFHWSVHANEITPVSPLLAKLPHEFPEITPGKGDGLVADARAHLPWSIRHTLPINHAQALWDRTLQQEVAAILLGTKSSGGLAGAVERVPAVAAEAKSALDALFDIVPNAALKGRLGHLVLEYPAGAKFDQTSCEVCEPPAEAGSGKGERVADGYGSRSFELIAGKYDVYVSGARVPAVEVRAKSDTKLRLGGLHVVAGGQTQVELYDAEGKTRLVDFYGERTVGLPVGRYLVRIAKKQEPVTIESGTLTEF